MNQSTLALEEVAGLLLVLLFLLGWDLKNAGRHQIEISDPSPTTSS